MRKMNVPLHTQIVIGMVLGVLWGVGAVQWGGQELTLDFIRPWGQLFIRLLKVIAIPVIIGSLIMGVNSLRDLSSLSRMGLRTIGIYVGTTVLAITVGIVIVHLLDPGAAFPASLKEELQRKFAGVITTKVATAQEVREGPLAFIERLVPSNIFQAMADNRSMLQVVLFTLFFGVALLLIPDEKSRPVVAFFDGFNEAITRMIELIMKAAPFGVFALMASMIVELTGDNPAYVVSLLKALGLYSLTVLIGLALMVFGVYPTLLKIFTPMKIGRFFRGLAPAQLLAFSTSSSAATLPVTMEQCEKKLGIGEEVASFVLPIGATVNMDGTSLYQAVATFFIASAFGVDLTFSQTLTVIITATVASIGAAGVPGSGLIMLVIVLQSVGIDPAGIALILAVDRLLDMFRTVVNVTGDATVATIVATSEKKLHLPS